MRILCVFGKHNYGNPKRGVGIEYASFLPAFRRLGHEVIFFESMDRERYQDFKELNRSLLDIIEKERPDVLFAVLFTFEVWLETWDIIRESGITATINWTTDDSWKYFQSSRFIAPHLHAFTTTYPRIYQRYIRDNINQVLLTQWAANADTLAPPIPASDCQYEVTFVGTAHEPRKKWVSELAERGVEVECFGYGWPNGPVDAGDIPKIIRHSVISLNFSNAGLVWDGLIPRRENQLKARTFEVPGAGGFLLTEWADDVDKYYLPGREIAFFHDIDCLTKQIQYYLSHPKERDQIADAGFARTQEEHTYDQRLTEVLDFVLDMKQLYEVQKHIVEKQSINWDRFTQLEKGHEPSKFQLWLKKVLVQIGSAIWGPERGPRAMRALIFQLSYRFVGKHTYSAAGWPGRMFYKES